MEEEDTTGSPHFCYLASSDSADLLQHPLDATVHSARRRWWRTRCCSSFRQFGVLYLHGRVIRAFNLGQEHEDRIDRVSLADRGVPEGGLVLCEVIRKRREVPKHTILDLPPTTTPTVDTYGLLSDEDAQRRGRANEPCTAPSHPWIAAHQHSRVIGHVVCVNSKAQQVLAEEHRTGHQARRTECASGAGG
jgi:hypothetical protein